MPESTLLKSMTDIKTEVADYCRFGRSSSVWSTDQAARLTSYLTSGLHQFYFPPILPGESVSHPWSFLKPYTTLTTVADTYLYDMPDNFAFIEGLMVHDAAMLYRELKQVSPEKLLAMRAMADISQVPQLFAIRPKSAGGVVSTKYEMLMYPTPDAAYLLNYQYALIPDALSAEAPYPLGGPQHAETILESCLAIAEQRIDDKIDIHQSLFMQKLQASVAIDRRVGASQWLGRNRNPARFEGFDYRRARTLTYVPG